MGTIIIGFTRPSGWFEPFSWLIRLVCWTPYSHVYIKFYSKSTDRWLIYQASGTKLNFIGQTLFDAEEVLCGEFEIPITFPTRNNTIQFCIDNVGKPYAVGQIIGFACVLFMKIFGKKIKNPFYNGNSYFCSELVGDILEELLKEGGSLDPSISSPKDIWNFLLSKGFKQSSTN